MERRQPRVAIYARVSTADQDPELQLVELRRLVADRGWQLVSEYVDRGFSGTELRRPELKRLLEAVHHHACELVLVWKLDRLGRSVPDLFHLIDSFRTANVEFVSLRDPGFDTTTAGGKLIFTVFAAVAAFERDLISERTRAGLALARRRGVRLGHPKLLLDGPRIRADREKGFSMRELARTYHVSATTIWRILGEKTA